MSQQIENLPIQAKHIQEIPSISKAKTAVEDEKIQNIQKCGLSNQVEPPQHRSIKLKNAEMEQKCIEQQQQQRTIQVQTQKQKYRLHSQFFQSIHSEKERKVVEFDQFPQHAEQNAFKNDCLPQTINNQGLFSEYKNKLDFSFSQSKQIISPTKDEPKKVMQMTTSPLKQENSKKIIGKISKKIVHQKKIHETIISLQKNDPKKKAIPRLQQRKKRDEKPDLQKLQTNIRLNSNIISLTIGQLVSREDNEAVRLLDQIQLLKYKLYSMEHSMKRQEQQNQEEIQQNRSKYQSIQQQLALMNKHNNRQNQGQFYRRIQFNNSKLSQQLQTVGLSARRSNKSETVRSAPKPRFSSFQERSHDNNNQSKNGFNSFRARKNKLTQNNTNEATQIGFIKVKEKSLQKDQCFQTKRQAHPKLEFTQDEIMSLIEKPSPRQLTFNQNFRQYIQKHFLQLGDEVPKRNSKQQQLVQLAKSTLKKFGVNLQTQKQTLHIKKYKNCVSFIVDSSRTILWYYQGKFYFGNWLIKEGDGQKNGWGYQYSPKKFVYSGFFRENKREGSGIIKFLTNEDFAIYQGYWKDGFKNGKGKQRQTDGSIYIGQWLNGKKNGKGILKNSQKQAYEGHFQNGFKSGQGRQTFASGDTFVGNYKQGKFHGFGTYTWANLSRYEGQFRNGSRNGQGIWVSDYRNKRSDNYEGQYKDDKKSGFGFYRWKDGTIYEGEFQNDLKHGQGVVTYADSRSTRLQWFQGNIVLRQTSIEHQQTVRKGSINAPSIQRQRKSVPKPSLVKFNIKSNSKSRGVKPI